MSQWQGGGRDSSPCYGVQMFLILALALAATPDGGVAHGYSRVAVRRVVNAHQADLRACGQRFVASGMEITLTFVISPEGKVRDIAVESMNVTDAMDAVDCLNKALRSWTFPSPGKTSAKIQSHLFVLK